MIEERRVGDQREAEIEEARNAWREDPALSWREAFRKACQTLPSPQDFRRWNNPPRHAETG